MSTNSLYPGTTNGVCVTSIIKDKIREYMMGDSSQQIVKSPVEISICEVDKENAADSVIQENKNVNKQDPVSTTDLILPSSLDVSIHNSTEPCPHKQDIVNSVRRIGNSLDALLQESKKASHTKPVKKSSLSNHQNTDRLFISSDQLRSRKSVSLHDICEEYIQFITVNSSVSGDEETISTTSENGTERNAIKEEEPELEIIPVSAALPIRHSQISVITINECSPRNPSNTVIKQSVEEMHVAVENECEKSNGDNDNGDKLASEKEIVDTTDEKIFTNVNGVKSPVEQKEKDSAVAIEESIENVAEKEPNTDEKLTLSNGISHNVNDNIEEEDIEEDVPQLQTVESPKPGDEEKPPESSSLPNESVDEKLAPEPAPPSPMETDQTNEEPKVAENETKVIDEPNQTESKIKDEPEKETEKIEQPVKQDLIPKAVETVEEKITEKVPDRTPTPEETKMDTSEPEPETEPVTKIEETEPPQTKPDTETTTESKPIESTDNDKEAEAKKIKAADESTPNQSKVDKKPAELEKEAIPVVKEGIPAITNNVAGVKRKADAADDVEQDRDGGISSSSSTSGSEADNAQDCKRIRFDESIFEEDERERLIREFVERSTESADDIGKNCDKLQHEIAALSDLSRAKELEWNSIMRLLKLKEEMLERILFKKRHLDCQNKPELDANLSKMYKNYVSSSSTVSADQNKPNRNEPSPPTSVSNHVTVTPVSTAGSPASASNGALNSTSQDSFAGKPSSGVPATSENVGGKSRQHRPILPKPPVTSAQAAQPSSHGSHVAHVTQQQPPPQQPQQPALLAHSSQPPQPSSMMQPGASLLIDQNSVIGEGRQGPIVDVKSIIADFRSKNPDSLPRRGRRSLMPFGGRIPDGNPGPRFLANTSLLSMANMAMGSGSHVRTSVSSTTHNDHRSSGFLIGQDNSMQTSLGRTEMQMRHPNIDSLMLSVNAAAAGNSSQANSSTNSSNSNSSSFQEALVKFAKMNEKRDISSNAGLHLGSGKGGSHLPPPPPYPEVTLHPVLVPQSSGSPPVQNSLLHGILTKSNAAAAAAANQHHPSSTVGNVTTMNSVGNIQHRPTTFSPTLARLLTAPERNRVSRSAVGSSSRSTKSTLNEILNSKKTRTEVTITPVTTSAACTTKNGSDVVLDDDDESEAADRLVIDEGREVAAENASNVIPADQVPECQGCHKKAAQFVCAGCGNQWYCSRECQVQAWEDHSEMCSG